MPLLRGSFFLPIAPLIASAATSPNISSTSFLAPAILSANVILSVGGANLANDFCFGVIAVSKPTMSASSILLVSVNSLLPTLNLPPFGVLAKAPVNALPSSVIP